MALSKISDGKTFVLFAPKVCRSRKGNLWTNLDGFFVGFHLDYISDLIYSEEVGRVLPWLEKQLSWLLCCTQQSERLKANPLLKMAGGVPQLSFQAIV